MAKLLANPSVLYVSNVTKAAKRLTKLGMRKILKELDVNPDDDNALVSPAGALLLWVNDLSSTFPVTSEQADLILMEFKPSLVAFSDELWKSIGSTNTAVCYLGIGDRAYASITGGTKLLNLSTGQWVDGLKVQFLETVQYNLTTLFMQRYLTCLVR